MSELIRVRAHEFAHEFAHDLPRSWSVGGRLAIGWGSAEGWLWDRVGKGG